ncbi:hypothetical protein [Treponema endosymbiont of Eucomonympha sp.]|uniref:hypothetical protein n=1 Tax=Treponema endosymbiont of Eucomonympha sp. TaxID=1580831 RepID=UPI00078046C1|nr:hypothetical protein [Treponema endosymbiont of Eucomonympha sp.]
MKKRALFALPLTALACAGCLQAAGLKAEAPNAAAVLHKSGDAKYGDGTYTFYLRNGKNITGDCDGYSYDGRWYTVYEYFQRDIAKWDERLFDAGILHDTYKTSDITKYCSVTFSAEYVIGVGKEEEEHFIAFANDDIYFDMNKRGEGCRAKAENVWATLYARADERLAFFLAMQRTLKLPKGAASAKRQFPVFAFVFAKRSDCEKKKGWKRSPTQGCPCWKATPTAPMGTCLS